ncbi:helix-turn-helix transcriptional regulator [Photobacterium lucens]|uniref:helix-turn-helix transcriptional regulator n=1 Tax=Photobacterium lucens TaxID=2562949 RepID=UPI00136F7E1A|nr:AlpA family transcriptional regulator [Photobacterium lucens]MBP2699139.1 AlpA family transcriptional regulator [Vibrio parahaemolyticus]MZG56833.1 AlpA family transcriptional regulator [Photobacterium lucens]MZG79502.1 AlpA family transcriptional regulator [Photobacterium lucens]
MNKIIITPKELCDLTGKSRITIWRWIKEDILPEPMRINGVVLGWEKVLLMIG